MRLKTTHLRQFLRPFHLHLDLSRPARSLDDFDARMRLIMRRHLSTLAWWSVLNIAAGVLGLFLLDGFWYYFAMMGLSWGVINLALVLFLFKLHFLNKFREGDALERIEAQFHVEKILVLNLGLDLGYALIGAWVREHGLHIVENQALWLGFGWSVIVQGLYLFVHDLAFYRLHRRNYRLGAAALKECL